jgi:hypothetical protein
MGRGNYIPPVRCYSSADYDCIYVDDELVYGEEHWEKCSQADYYYLYEDFKETLIDSFLRRFPSFVRNDAEWLDNQTKIVAENELCMLTVCDYDTYLAVSVIAKESEYDPGLVNLANKHLNVYAAHLKKFALDTYGEYRVRDTAWTSATVRREDAKQEVA